MQVTSLPASSRYSITRDAMISIRDAARSARADVDVSFAPSPIDFARSNANVDWANYVADGVVMEVIIKSDLIVFENSGHVFCFRWRPSTTTPASAASRVPSTRIWPG